ncbi:MAG: hypothetical protein ACI87W_003635 [Halieaceae bacterium]
MPPASRREGAQRQLLAVHRRKVRTEVRFLGVRFHVPAETFLETTSSLATTGITDVIDGGRHWSVGARVTVARERPLTQLRLDLPWQFQYIVHRDAWMENGTYPLGMAE